MKPLIPLFALMLTCMFNHPLWAQKNESPVVLAIHGGAGTILKKNLTSEMEKAIREALSRALDTGWQILGNGGSSVDAVAGAVAFLEDSPLFNAGKGSVFTSEGKNEMDASIMEGQTLRAGAVAIVTTIKNPVLAARAVMEKSPHVMLAGQGAEQFARDQGLEIVDPSYFYTERRRKALEESQKNDPGDGMNRQTEQDRKHGTVGAVAVDGQGNLAAATSTGGMTNKKYGRVGDSPIIGAGTYADNASCAVSCTGHGEYFIRLVAAHHIASLVKYRNMNVQEAGDTVIIKHLGELDGTGGAIILDRKGNLSMPFNTEGMYRGFVRADGSREILLYGAD